MTTQLTETQINQVRQRISETFGDWTVVEDLGDCLLVEWDFGCEGLGIHRGYVEYDYSDWTLQSSHHSSKHTACVTKYDASKDDSLYLQADGSMGYEPHWFTVKRAKVLAKKISGNVVMWY